MDKATDAPGEADRRRFAFPRAGQMWMSDVMHGPTVWVGGRKRKTYLIAFIDDATRVIPHGAFALAENTSTFLPVLKQALLKRGQPARLYVDNGSHFRSRQLSLVCAKLGTALIHARPYRPQGKDYVSHCTSFVRFGSTWGKRRRCASLRPWALTGGSSPGCSYRHSPLSL